jgi:hypothetical protein
MKPDFKQWAEALIHGITGDETYNPKLVKWVEAELNDIADKYYQMGFEDGDKDGWWTEQEKIIKDVFEFGTGACINEDGKLKHIPRTKWKK